MVRTATATAIKCPLAVVAKLQLSCHNCNVAITQLQRRNYAMCELTRLLVSDFYADHTGDHLATTLTPIASWR